MARPFRHQHGIASRDQPARQCAVFGLRHLRAAQRVLRRSMRDQRQRKRPLARRTKQQRVRRDVAIWRWHQPLLPPVRLAFRALTRRIERRALRMGGAGKRRTSTTRAENALKNCMNLPARGRRKRDCTDSASRLPTANQIRQHFFANQRCRRIIAANSFALLARPMPPEAPSCPFSVQPDRN